MNRSLSSLVVGVLAATMVHGLVAGAQTDQVQAGPPAGSSRDLITHILPGAGNQQTTQMVVIDSSRLVVAVYHISNANGEIQLKSARPIHWDLELSDYNSVDPLPEHIQSMIERQR